MGEIVKFRPEYFHKALTGTEDRFQKNNTESFTKASKVFMEDLLKELKEELFGFNEISDRERIEHLKKEFPELELSKKEIEDFSYYFKTMYKGINFNAFYKTASSITKKYNTDILKTIFDKIIPIFFENLWDDIQIDSIFIIMTIELELENIYCFHLYQIILDIISFFYRYIGIAKVDVEKYRSEIRKLLWPVLILDKSVSDKNFVIVSNNLIDQFVDLQEDFYNLNYIIKKLKKTEIFNNIKADILEDAIDRIINFLIKKNFKTSI